MSSSWICGEIQKLTVITFWSILACFEWPTVSIHCLWIRVATWLFKDYNGISILVKINITLWQWTVWTMQRLCSVFVVSSVDQFLFSRLILLYILWQLVLDGEQLSLKVCWGKGLTHPHVWCALLWTSQKCSLFSPYWSKKEFPPTNTFSTCQRFFASLYIIIINKFEVLDLTIPGRDVEYHGIISRTLWH